VKEESSAADDLEARLAALKMWMNIDLKNK
jgi:hypothetical protein